MKTMFRALLAAGLAVWTCCTAVAIVPPEGPEQDLIRKISIHTPGVLISPASEYHAFTDAGVAWNAPAWNLFLAANGSQWDIGLDRRSGRPDLIQGQGIPWIPGRGNKLTASDLAPFGYTAGAPVTVELLAALAEVFMEENPELFRADHNQLKLDYNGSFISNSGTYAVVKFAQVHERVNVRKSHIFFRINNGNLIQFGAFLYENVKISAKPAISPEQAFNIAADYAELNFPCLVEPVAPAELLFIVTAAEGVDYAAGTEFAGIDGTGYAHRLVYAQNLLCMDEQAEFETYIDAQTGELLVFQDGRKYGTVDGGIYPVTNLDTEVVRPFGYANVTNGTVKVTDSGGNYSYGSGSATISLNGPYVNVSDRCGSISLSTSTPPGDLHFQSSSGTDCTTPGVGGAGNTHAARSCFYHINMFKAKARYYRSNVSWLTANLTANVNILSTCNAYWGSGSVNFYRSGGGCSNTGEIASVFLHETGHGLDTYDGNGFSIDAGSGEVYADICSALLTHVSCIGHNFVPGSPCSFGCDSTCTGVRDLQTAVDVRPSNIASSPADCDRWTCPYTGYLGPMGYEGHCESLIASQAYWDAIVAVRAARGDAAGWTWADRLFFLGTPTLDAAYQVTSGGTCNPSATVNGCGSTNYYTVFLGLDDDNGNLADGTPNACYLWQEFTDHGIACNTGSHVCYSICPEILAPQVTGSSGGGAAQLTWSPVTNAASYEIFRNDVSCNYSWNPVATVTTTSYTDTAVAPGVTYYYMVQGIGTDPDCRGYGSDCVVITIATGPTNTPTIAPTLSPTRTPTRTPSRTPTRTPTVTPTYTATNSPTLTPTVTLSPTRTPTVTLSPTRSPTLTPTIGPSLTPTLTPTVTLSPTRTGTPTVTLTPTNSPTATPTRTPTLSPTPTRSPTFTATLTPTLSPTVTLTPTPTPSPIATNTPTLPPWRNRSVTSLAETDNNPDIAEVSGAIYVVFDRLASVGNRDIYLTRSTDQGLTWTEYPILTDSRDTADPAITVDDGGRLWVVFENNAAADQLYLYATSTDQGATWSVEELSLSGYSTADADRPDVDAVGSGGSAIVYTAWEYQGDIRYFFSTDGGSSWTYGTLDGAGFTDRYPSVAIGSSRVVIVMESEYSSTDRDIISRRRLRTGGSWGSAVYIAGLVNDERYPVMEITGTNGVCIWTDLTTGELLSKGTTDTASNWGSAGMLAENGQYPALTFTSSGARAAYEINGTIRFASSSNLGAAWTDGGEVTDSAQSLTAEWGMSAITYGAGLPFVVWEDARAGDPGLFFDWPAVTPTATPTVTASPTRTPTSAPTLSPTPTASPVPTLTPTRTPSPNPTATPSPEPTATQIPVTPTGTPEPSATPSVCDHNGDVNDDGSITPSDAQLAFTFYMECEQADPAPAEYCAADYCGVGTVTPCDGAVTPGDAQAIFAVYLGYPDPCEQ